jgi:hypothetical protein
MIVSFPGETTMSNRYALARQAILVIGIASLCGIAVGAPVQNIVIDGSFSDWNVVPSHYDPQNDQHDTDHSGQFDTPTYVNHPDVDLLEYKFAHDEQNLYAYFRARGQIGRTQQHSAGRAGRYYVIVTIDVDNNDTTGYWLHEGGYYPTSRGYDMNMELEFYDGAFNTGHYLSHDALTGAEYTQDLLNLTSGEWTQNNDGPYTPGFVQPAPGNYDDYTQWVYQNNDTLMLVRDGGPVVPGIVSYALSPDGHELEMRAPFKGFLKTAANNPNMPLGKTLDVSFSLEASGELFAPPGSNGTWASDTAQPITSYFLGSPVPGDYNGNGAVDAADYVVWRHGGPLLNEIDAPGTVNSADYAAWRARFGNSSAGSGAGLSAAIPEPGAALLTILGLTCCTTHMKYKRCPKRLLSRTPSMRPQQS